MNWDFGIENGKVLPIFGQFWAIFWLVVKLFSPNGPNDVQYSHLHTKII